MSTPLSNSQSKSRKKKSNLFHSTDLKKMKSNIELTSKQNILNDVIKNNSLTIVSGPAGTSKAQPLDCPILTPNGWDIMGNIKKGDYVISNDGNPTKVVDVFPQGYKDIYEVFFSDGTSTECCEDHLWLTQTDKDINNRKWSKTINGKRERYSSPRKGSVKTTKEIIDTLYTKRGRKNHRIPITHPVNFEKKDTVIDPYIFGFLLGDGCFRGKGLSVSTSDDEIIHYIKNNLPKSLIIKKSEYSKYDYFIRTKDKKNKYIRYLKELNLWGKYSYEKSIPDLYKFNSIENRISLLRGLMDSDGTTSSTGLYTSFASTSINLINDVIELVQSLGGIATKHTESIPNYNYNKKNKKGKISYTITITMNPDINPFMVKRKHDKVIPKTKYKPKRLITNIKKIGVKKAQCIKVDNPERLYLTNNYIVTHNTFTTCYTALELLGNRKIEEIIITKPLLESSFSMGFLPGTVEEKIEPYMKSYISTFKKMVGVEKLKELMSNDVIKIETLNFMRGETYDGAILLLDEGQNLDMKDLMLWITRLGNNSKAVLMGDVSQYDVRENKSNFKSFRDILKGMDDFDIFEFEREDIVRNPFLVEVTDRYERWKYGDQVD